jgi:hypothetical protein
MARPHAQALADDVQRQPLHYLGLLAAWSGGTFALAGVVILFFGAAVLPWRSAVSALGYGILLMFPGLVWGILTVIVFESTDQHGFAAFVKVAFASSLMFVGVGFLFAGYTAVDSYLSGEPPGYLGARLFVLVACGMPAFCLLSAFPGLAAYMSLVAAFDYVMGPGPVPADGKDHPDAAAGIFDDDLS